MGDLRATSPSAAAAAAGLREETRAAKVLGYRSLPFEDRTVGSSPARAGGRKRGLRVPSHRNCAMASRFHAAIPTATPISRLASS